MVNVPVTVPLVGVKVTVIVQFAPAARLVGQLLDSPKLLAPAVTPMLVIATEAPETLLMVTGRDVVVDENVRLLGDTVVPVAVLVPFKVTDCGLPAALSVMVKAPVTAVVPAGV
jgi:hypothetical protein